MQQKPSARTIEVPKEKIQEVADILLASIKAGPVGFLKDNQVAIMQTAAYDTMGRLWHVSVRLETTHTGDTKAKHVQVSDEKRLKEVGLQLNDIGIAIVLGLVKKNVKNGKVELEMRDGPENLTDEEQAQMQRARMASVISMLTHEYTHVRDPDIAKPDYFQPGNFDRASLEDRKKYLNQDVEVRAVMNQVLVEIESYVNGAADWRELVQKSPSWRTMVEPYLEPRKKAKIIDAVQRRMEQAA